MRTAHSFAVPALALSLIALPAATGCLVEPEFKPPQIAFAPRTIAVATPTPKFRARPLLSPVVWTCVRIFDFPRPAAVDGLIDLFGSVANLRAAVASDTLRFAFDGLTVTQPCGLGMLGTSEKSDTAWLRNLLLDDASYDWRVESAEDAEPLFTARLVFSSNDRTVVAEIAPQSGMVRILVDNRETGRAVLLLPPLELEALLATTRSNDSE